MNTGRQVDNLRAESMRWASYMLTRLRMSVLGKPVKETCECGKEYELFPNQPIALTNSQVNAIKFDVGQIYSGLEPEDLDKATEDFNPREARERSCVLISKDSLISRHSKKNPNRTGTDPPLSVNQSRVVSSLNFSRKILSPLF